MQAEERAWESLVRLEPRDVCARSLAQFDASAAAYTLSFLGRAAVVVAADRTISATGPEGELLLTKLAHFSRLSILHYLIAAQPLPAAGQLVRPSDLTVGQLYFAGSHVLPLNPLAAAYARDAEGFLKQGRRFGGRPCPHGDAAVELPVFPRLPVTLILWREDDEFPARADLLFDATCERHVPADILWSVAMLCTKLMLPRQ